MRSVNADECPSDQLMMRHRFWRHALLLAACIAPVLNAHAKGLESRNREASRETGAGQLSIQVNDDRLTLAAAKVPQIYLYGVIDAGAPQRFEALMRSRKIPAGSDIYLDSLEGNRSAGIALGRLFRSNSMVTHLGTPRRKLPDRKSVV